MRYRESLNEIFNTDYQSAPAEKREQSVGSVTMVCSLACGGLTLQPIPGLETGIIGVQLGMVIALAHIYGQELNRKRAREVILDLGAITGVNIIGRQALTTLGKVILPGIGGVIAAPAAFALCWGTGHAAAYYFKTGGRADKQQLKKIFEQEKKRGRRHYSATGARDARPEGTDLGGDTD